MKKQLAQDATQQARLKQACILVVLVGLVFLAAVTLPSLIKKMTTEDIAEASEVAGVKGVWSALSSNDGIASAMSGAGYAILDNSSAAPEWITQELFSIDQLNDGVCFAANKFSSIAILREGVEDSAGSYVKQLLEASGWAFHPAGIDGAYSAIKDSGSARWLFLETVISNGSTVYVLTVNV